MDKQNQNHPDDMLKRKPVAIEFSIVFDNGEKQTQIIDIVGATSIETFQAPEVEEGVDFNTGTNYKLVTAVAYTILVEFKNGLRFNQDKDA